MALRVVEALEAVEVDERQPYPAARQQLAEADVERRAVGEAGERVVARLALQGRGLRLDPTREGAEDEGRLAEQQHQGGDDDPEVQAADHGELPPGVRLVQQHRGVQRVEQRPERVRPQACREAGQVEVPAAGDLGEAARPRQERPHAPVERVLAAEVVRGELGRGTGGRRRPAAAPGEIAVRALHPTDDRGQFRRGAGPGRGTLGGPRDLGREGGDALGQHALGAGDVDDGRVPLLTADEVRQQQAAGDREGGDQAQGEQVAAGDRRARLDARAPLLRRRRIADLGHGGSMAQER